MGKIWFQAGGPLLADSPVYIVREADALAANCLRRMDYITLFEPREHGKTSLVNRLIGRFASRNYCFAVRDLMAARSSVGNVAEWYSSLGEWMLRQLSFVPETHLPQLPIDCASWERFLVGIAEAAQKLGKRVVIVLDEAGAIPSDWSTDFFSVIRSVYTSRQNLSFWQHLTFIIAGAFNPRDLIRDRTVSNFNVDQRIALPDFDLPQVVTLASRLSNDHGVSQAIAERVYHWTDGQPYLCQRLCLYLANSPLLSISSDIERAVDHAVDQLFRDDTHHLGRIAELKVKPELLGYARRIVQSPDIRFSAALNDMHFELAHVAGVVKPTADGMCKIRNLIYVRALSELDESSCTRISPSSGSRNLGLPPPRSTDTELSCNLRDGGVVVLAGAGLSNGAGLPDWYALIAELAARIGYKLAPREWATGDALIDAAQAYVNRQGLHSLISHLKNRLDTTGKQPSAAHHALTRLPIPLVFTANFDDLLERAFRDAGKRVEVVVKDSSIPFMRRGPDTVNIVKLYGDLDQPDTIVLARQQYESYFLQRPQMVKLLETELARSDTLYLGWSGSDPYFKLVFGELLSRFGQMMRPGYAVMFDVTDDQRDELRRKQIRLVELPAGDRTVQLAGWLVSLMPATTLPETSVPTEDKELTIFEVYFRGDLKQAVQALAVLKRPWYKFIQPTNLALFGLERELRTDADMHQLWPTAGRITLERQWRGGQVLTVRIPSAHKERLMSYWEAIKARLEADGWLEETQGSALEGPATPATSVKGEEGSVSTSKMVLNTSKAWAVLVGVNQYENQAHIPSLHVCVDDVTAVHATLAGKYTATRLLTDNTLERLPTRANILAELSSVAQAAVEGDLLLFYFSGHGIAEGGESYLLPRDAKLAALKHTAVAMKDVREIVAASPARAKVIVLDACHSGAAIGKAGPAMTPEFIERVFNQAEGLAMLASCKQGQQSWEWPEEGRSVFTHFLLEGLSGKADFDGKGFVTVSDASRYVTDGVKAWAVDHGVPQTPTLQYTVAGDIVLLKV